MEENNEPRGLKKYAHPGPNLPSYHKIATSSNRTLDTPYLIKISKNIFISNVLKGTWPLTYAIINQGVPHELIFFSQAIEAR